ncbi:hypothetical protein [Haliangium sp.]|uniref:YncE family protein n=1 Tax=Haliangium sp. TaxID=2663208 RepID=UPI003D0D9DD5
MPPLPPSPAPSPSAPPRRRAPAALLLACAGLLVHPSCGTGGEDGGAAPGFPDAGTGTPECFSSNDCPTGWSCTEFGVCLPPSEQPGEAPPPPEREYELSAPVSSLRYVYVAMTEEDRLARIDGETLEVRSLGVGERPEVVATVPGGDGAVVLDAVNGAATILVPAPDGDFAVTLPTLPNLNRLDVAPDGRHALAWFDLDQAVADAGGLGAVERVGSFQDVTVLRLPAPAASPETEPTAPLSIDLTVGFRPRAVHFDDSGARAYVITEDGISVIALAAIADQGPGIVAPIPVSTDPLADPAAMEVLVMPTGELAVVREAGRAELRLVRWSDDARPSLETVPLPAPPTDVDLHPLGHQAFAVLRETSTLAVVSLPPVPEEPATVELIDLDGAAVGSLALSPDGARGVLFTNAEAAEQVTVIELDQPDRPHRVWPLQKSVRAVHFAPDGRSAVIVHAKAPGDPGAAVDFDEFIDKSHGYSVFDTATGFAKLQITPVTPGPPAFARAAPRAYLTLDGGDADGAVTAVHVLELDTGVVRSERLSSPPETVGVLPEAGVAFVGQRHPLGRISFLPVADGPVRTITGFDLNSRIID